MWSLIKFAVDYVFPLTCLSCEEFTVDINSFCGNCWLMLDFISQPYCRTYTEIAKIFARLICDRYKPFYANILLKPKWTKSQTSLSKAARKKNIKGTIKFNSKYDIKDKNILLIDDVMTTGMTIEEYSKVLKLAGASFQ